MSKENSAFNYYIEANKKYQQRDYQGAINAFHYSLSIDEKEWKSYCGLGWALFKTKQYLKAIGAFKNSIEIKNNWAAYHGLSSALFITEQYKEAIDTFRKSLSLKEDWNAYKGLGWALLNTQQYTEAISAFTKSLSLREDSNSYQGLGSALIKTNRYVEGENAFKKSVKLIESKSPIELSQVQRQMANLYESVGKVDASKHAWDKYFSYVKPIFSIDPFLGSKGIYQQISNDYLEEMKRICKTNGLDFVPSFEGSNDSSGETWKHLMYLHIHKCGGSSIIKPIQRLMTILYNFISKRSNLLETKNYLSIVALKSDQEVSALMRSITAENSRDLTSIFFSPHLSSWSPLYQHISKMSNTKPRIFCTIRNPKQRLLSQIKHWSGKGNFNSIEDFYSGIECENSMFNNLMHRSIFAYGLDTYNYRSKSRISFLENNNNNVKLRPHEDIEFIDVSDYKTISKVKSAFLSASLLPNIIQPTRFNETTERESNRGQNLSDDELDYIFNRCIEKGFLEKDESINYQQLKRRTLDGLNLHSLPNESSFRIHPLTFIISKKGKCSIIPTKKFLNDPHDFIIK